MTSQRELLTQQPTALRSGLTYHFDGKEFVCPFECFTQVIRGKWRTSLLLVLKDGQQPFNTIHRQLPGISAKVLSENLRALEKGALVSRHVYATVPPSVEYSLSEQGEKLVLMMDEINAWVEKWLSN